MGVLAKMSLIALLFKVQIIFSSLLVPFKSGAEVIQCRLSAEKGQSN